MSETGYVDVDDGGRLFFTVDGAGPPVVMIHGAPILDHRMWRREAVDWADRYTIVRYDLRGYGRSSVPTGGYRHGDDLAALVEHLGLGAVRAVGNSFGATIALDAALSHPGLVDALVLAPLAPLQGWKWTDGFPLASALRDADTRSVADVAEDIIGLPMNAAARERPDVVALLREMAGDYSGWHFAHRDPGTWIVPDAVDRLDELTVPTLVVTGEHDVADVVRIGDVTAAGVDGAHRIAIGNAGHAPNLENPPEFDRHVLPFLDSRPR